MITPPEISMNSVVRIFPMMMMMIAIFDDDDNYIDIYVYDNCTFIKMMIMVLIFMTMLIIILRE